MTRYNKELKKVGLYLRKEDCTADVVGFENGFIIVLVQDDLIDDRFFLIDRRLKLVFSQYRYKDDIVFAGGNNWGSHTFNF